MKLTKNHKIIIGVLGLGVLAYATKKYWMPKKKTTVTTPTNTTENVRSQSAPTNAPALVTSSSPKREELLNKLTQPTGGKVDGGSMSVSIDKSFYKNFTDRELEIMLIMSELEKVAKSKEDAKNLMKQKGITEADLKNIGEKMKNAFQGK